jgi:uridine kinase
MRETLCAGDEFDKHGFEYTEIEKQFEAAVPDAFDHFKDSAELMTIEQLYLSHPDEPFSLRLREAVSDAGIEYTATLKDRGRVVPNGLMRLEIETLISPEAYRHYASKGTLPTLRKLRATPTPGVSIDWTDHIDAPVVEIEAGYPGAQRFYETYGPVLMDKTGDPAVSSEALAYQNSPDTEVPVIPPFDTDELVRNILRMCEGRIEPLVIGISGRSGSGKTTLANRLVDRLACQPDAESDTVRISTDDYHKGKRWLETTYKKPWINWDAPEVYDTKALAFDLWQLAQGRSIEKRRFDFATEEPCIEGIIEPPKIIVIDGIYAGSPDLASQRHLHVPVETPLATSVGRRLSRDVREGRLNVSLGRPEDILRYQLEIAEPMHEARQRTIKA